MAKTSRLICVGDMMKVYSHHFMYQNTDRVFADNLLLWILQLIVLRSSYLNKYCALNFEVLYLVVVFGDNNQEKNGPFILGNIAKIFGSLCSFWCRTLHRLHILCMKTPLGARHDNYSVAVFSWVLYMLSYGVLTLESWCRRVTLSFGSRWRMKWCGPVSDSECTKICAVIKPQLSDPSVWSAAG